MNLDSEKKLSMDELMEMNRPTQTPQHPITEVHPTKEEWVKMMDSLYTLSYHAESQTYYLKQLPTRTQIDELLKTVKHLEQVSEQAGKPKESSFSLPSIRLPRMRLPHLDGPTWVVLLMSVAVLLLLWWGLGGIWNNLSLMLR